MHCCKWCGAPLTLEAGHSVTVCPICRVRQTVPSLSDPEQLQTFSEGWQLLRAGKIELAAEVFDLAMLVHSEQAEGYWGHLLCRYAMTPTKTGNYQCNLAKQSSIMDDVDWAKVMAFADPEARVLYTREATRLEDLRRAYLDADYAQKAAAAAPIPVKKTDRKKLGNRIIWIAGTAAVILSVLIILVSIRMFGGSEDGGTKQPDTTLQNTQPAQPDEPQADEPQADVPADAVLEGLELLALPEKLTYVVGSSLDTEGMMLKALFSDGSALLAEDFVCTPLLLDKAGTQTVTVTYEGLSVDFEVTVEDAVLTKLELVSEPEKLTYFVGDRLDPTGLVLLAVYNNGAEEALDTDYECSPTVLDKAGTQTVTVTCREQTVTFEVTVEDVVLTNLQIASKPDKLTYYVGDTLQLSGLTLTATYSNGTTKTVSDNLTTGTSVLQNAGTQTITVSYQGLSVSFEVTVKKPELTGISIKNPPYLTTYQKGDYLDTTGLSLTASYSNGTTKTVTEDFTCSPMVLNTVGTQTITVSYEGKSTSFTVNVYAVELVDLRIQSLPSKLVYRQGDTLDTSGLVLTAHYSDGSTERITGGYSCSPTTLDSIGTVTITVSYGGLSTGFDVTVNIAPSHGTNGSVPEADAKRYFLCISR